jgi:hypothetical protein
VLEALDQLAYGVHDDKEYAVGVGVRRAFQSAQLFAVGE